MSIVDGTNVPIAIQLSNSCSEASCPMDLNADCPAELQGPLDASGKVASCKSACVAQLDGNPADSANCCTGSHSERPACPVSGVQVRVRARAEYRTLMYPVQFYDYFKKSCPNRFAVLCSCGLPTCSLRPQLRVRI